MIVFESNRDGDWEIYLMEADGTGQMNLTNSPESDDRNPVPSRDGSLIYFESDRTGDIEIWAMPVSYHPDPVPQPGEPVQITANVDVYDGSPVIVPPHEKFIAFVSDLDQTNAQSIYAMSAEGALQTRLTDLGNMDRSPAWSPITSTLAYVTDRDGDDEIYTLHCTLSDTDIIVEGDPVNLTNNPRTPDAEPAWSRDGRHLVYASKREGYWDIYTMNADGSGQVNLSNWAADDRGPRWSHTGDQIAFASYRDGNWEIYVMTPDGDDLRRLTVSPRVDEGNLFDIDWAPNDELLAFSALTREFNQDIYAVDLEGHTLQALTKAPGDDRHPRWFSTPR
jgi:TolB protein